MPSRPYALLLLALVALLALLAAAPAPVVAQTATDTPANGTNATDAVGTVIEVEFDRPLPDAERRRAAGVVEARLNGSPSFNGTAVATDDGLVVQVRPTVSPAIVDLLLQRGAVSVTASTPEGEATLFENGGVTEVGGIRRGRLVPVFLTPEAAGNFAGTLQRLNVTDNPERCDTGDRTGYCLSVRLDGQLVQTAGVTPPLAEAIEDGSFNQSRGFSISADDAGTAIRLQVALAGEPLPANATATRVENVTAFEPIATPTATPEMTATATTPRVTTPGATTPGAESPGFTPATVLVALLALVALAHRVRS